MKHILILLVSILSLTIKAQQDTLQQKVFTFVEVMPEFPIGSKALMDTIRKNLKYPTTGPEMTGKVLIRFVINEQGKVTQPTVIRGLSPAYDAEVLKVVSALPPFKPGMQQGKPVKVYYTLPIQICL